MSVIAGSRCRRRRWSRRCGRVRGEHDRGAAVPFSWWAYQPRPFARELAGEDPRGATRAARLGLDAAGRVVFQHLRETSSSSMTGRATTATWSRSTASLSKLQRFVFADGRLVEEISGDGPRTLEDARP